MQVSAFQLRLELS
jgi:hypothetical protein